jgi:poly(3-hydroxyalkanoate) synthetase
MPIKKWMMNNTTKWEWWFLKKEPIGHRTEQKGKFDTIGLMSHKVLKR